MPPGIGRGMMQQFAEATLGTELIYSFVIIAISLMIYFSTKELYELTNHKGIKYFRLSFLFFAIAYFFRYFIKFFILVLDDSFVFRIPPQILADASLFALMYASSIAIFYLLLSVKHKEWNGKTKEGIFHAIAIIIAIASVVIENILFILEIYLLLLVFIGVVIYTSHREKTRKKHSYLQASYVLLLLFWMLNILDILVPKIFQTFQLFVYFSSIGIFLTILYKVLRKAG